MRLPLLAAFSLLLADPQSSGAQSSPEPAMTIERVGPGRWQATYVFLTPVTALRFYRAAAHHRERVWTISTPGYRWAASEDRVVLQLDSGARPHSSITVEFPEFTDPLPKDYELFQPFSDGAVAIYTGHFFATPVGLSGSDSAAVLTTLRIVPPRGTHAIVHGRIATGSVVVSDSAVDGTYVYLGTAEPIETEDLIAIVDPGMPAWLRAMFERGLPELFATYTDRFHASLPWKPVVLYSFDDADVAGYSSGGGTLEGLINLTLTGREWHIRSDAAAEQAFYILAHETAHLWNGQLVTSAGGPASWMHEGSADAMANDMLLASGLLDRSAWRQRREDAINRCSAQLSGGSLHSAARRGMFRMFYDCGFALAIWTEAAVRNESSGADLFTFWRELVRVAQAEGGKYDEDLYFHVLRGFGVGDSVVARMRRFLDGRGIEPFLAGLTSAGLRIAPGQGAPPRDYQDMLARETFGHLMAVACRQISFHHGDPIVTVALPECPPFSKSLRVYALEGFRLRDQAIEAYDAVASACATGRAVRVQGSDGRTLVRIPCERPLGPRPLWYRFQN